MSIALMTSAAKSDILSVSDIYVPTIELQFLHANTMVILNIKQLLSNEIIIQFLNLLKYT